MTHAHWLATSGKPTPIRFADRPEVARWYPSKTTERVMVDTDAAFDVGVRCQVWFGAPGRGKTMAAWQYAARIEARHPDALRPVAYAAMAGSDMRNTTGGQALGLYNVYQALTGERLTQQQLRQYQAHGLRARILAWCALQSTELLIIDEAGTQGSDMLRGIVQLAEDQGDGLTPVQLLLVGMPNLLTKIDTMAHTKRRIHDFHELVTWPPADQRGLLDAACPALAAAALPALTTALLSAAQGELGALVSLGRLAERRLALLAGSGHAAEATLVALVQRWAARRTARP